MSLPPLVLVSGAPAAGKSTLARRLAAELSLPLLTKDGIKELLGDTLGARDTAESQRLGVATYTLLRAMVTLLLDAGVGAALESNFSRGLSEDWLAPLATRSRVVLVHCEAEPATILRRYRERGERGERHAVHFDNDALPRVRAALAVGVYKPLALDVPTLRVDTTDGYQPTFDDILAFVRVNAPSTPA